MIETAIKFGQTLDRDEFEQTKKLLSVDCKYIIGDEILVGPKNICQSYEQNMIAGRKKLDVLEWGKSRIEQINNFEFYVHFADYLTHQGEKYTHRCTQKLQINEEGLISGITHVQTKKSKIDWTNITAELDYYNCC